MSELYWADYLTCDDLYGLRSMRVFLTSRQKMHPVGVEMYDDMMRRIEAGFADASRATSPTLASPAALPVSGSRQTTHWDDCWRDSGHHACAVARIERMSAALPVEAQPVASESAQHALAADPNFFKPVQFPQWDNNVAWLRYDDHNGRSATSLSLCDPDAEGAFKVYRHPAPASPAKGDGADRAVASTAGTDAADMIVELRTKLQNLIAELPDTRRLLIARIDAEATLKINKSDTQKDADVEGRRGRSGEG